MSAPAICRPQGLTQPFPGGWDITLQTWDGQWCAQKDTRALFAPSEAALYALVKESEIRRSRN